MSISRAPLVLLAAGMLALGFARAEPVRLQLTTETSYPGVYLEQGKVVGFGTEKVREIMRRTHIDYSIELLPWKRSYTLALTQPTTCVYSTTRTPERESLFKWVGPIVESDWVLYGRASQDYKLRTIDDARRMTIGVYIGDVRGDYLEARGFKVAYVANDDSNPRKLMVGRIDLWATSSRFAALRLRQTELTGKVVPLLTFNHAQLYLACNLAVPDKLVAEMNAALASMHADGTVRAIETHYEQIEARDTRLHSR